MRLCEVADCDRRMSARGMCATHYARWRTWADIGAPALSGKLLTLYMQSGGLLNDLAAAEAVAAKLVEVVCEQDDLIQIVGVDATNHRAAAADMRRERDAARAEVAALREDLDQRGPARWRVGTVDPAYYVQAGAQALVAGKTYGGWIHDEDAWRAATGIAEKVIAAIEPMIREQIAQQIEADLRAKVEGLRDQYQQYLDSNPTEQERGRAWSRVDSLNGVLAMIKEADRG